MPTLPLKPTSWICVETGLNDLCGSIHLIFKKNYELGEDIFLMFLFLRKRPSVRGRGAEREGDTESEGGSRLTAVSTESDAGLEPTNWRI